MSPDKAQPPHVPKPLTAAFEALNSATNRLHDAARYLRAKLAPILLPEDPAKDSGGEPRAIGSQTTEQVWQAVSDINAIYGLVRTTTVLLDLEEPLPATPGDMKVNSAR